MIYELLLYLLTTGHRLMGTPVVFESVNQLTAVRACVGYRYTIS